MEGLRWRGFGQWLAIAGGWVVFVWAWIHVGQRTSLPTVLWGVMVVAVMTVVALSVTLWWVVHNLRIHQRKGPRRSVPIAMPDYRADFLGRSLDADWSLLRRSSVVVVRIDDQEKRFIAGLESPGWGLVP
jgi:hypothetical protein